MARPHNAIPTHLGPQANHAPEAWRLRRRDGVLRTASRARPLPAARWHAPAIVGGAMVAMALAGLPSRGADRVPLRTALPRPAFSGTPAFIVSPNLEKPTGRLREPFLVPAGTTNLAAGRPVTGSQPQPFLGRYALVTDGDKEPDGDSFVELGPGLQWVQIVLDRPANIHAILVWHYHAEARVYRDVIVQLGDDPDMVRDLATAFNNDHDSSAGLGCGPDKEYVETFEGRLIPVDGRRARCVRLYSRGNTTDDMNHVIEVEVYGTYVEP